jgi:hypothetical protein
MLSLLSLFQDHHYILTPLDTLPSKGELIFYYKEGCPHANQVQGLLIDWINQQPQFVLTSSQATAQFPSPTLRIPIEDFYLNYIGVKEIKEAIKTTIFN